MANPAFDNNPIHVIGGGLAGSEAAWQIARPACRSSCTRCGPAAPPKRITERLAELVCSNSFRSDDADAMRSACCIGRCGRWVR